MLFEMAKPRLKPTYSRTPFMGVSILSGPKNDIGLGKLSTQQSHRLTAMLGSLAFL